MPDFVQIFRSNKLLRSFLVFCSKKAFYSMYDVVCVGSGLIGGAASSAFRVSRILARTPRGLTSVFVIACSNI